MICHKVRNKFPATDFATLRFTPEYAPSIVVHMLIQAVPDVPEGGLVPFANDCFADNPGRCRGVIDAAFHDVGKDYRRFVPVKSDQ